MFGILVSEPPSIAIDMTYDRSRLEEAIKKIAGNELKPTDIINGPSGSEGPSEVRYRAHVAFSTVYDLLNNLEQVHNRRKALVYVSDGYDFNPFQDSRLGLMDPNSPFAQNEFARNQNQIKSQQASDSGGSTQPDPFATQQKTNEEFADADLARELGDLTRRATTSFVRLTASVKYVSSTSAPMKSTPRRAQATAVLPNPVNGSIATLTRRSPCSRRHCSGSLVGKVAGCGRSRSRR